MLKLSRTAKCSTGLKKKITPVTLEIGKDHQSNFNVEIDIKFIIMAAEFQNLT